ncbi:4'-phosphopantetheinyl transferase superfamily protein [Flavobacterium sp. 1]|uniref:4'-phosphopantetheinyl transferase family protein n=1 Tax=Flavobacterium sp. 1 TaxID=2035200 RepID=UPI000C24119D|nr:4'-phosphopantetheinyl transferase superfamily protein [Flavobacterium sp. 1]PJJ09636.1 4'-phosphopantetheinyl transferase superfamily protein [Flavobacterium sp. 1]
MSLYKTIHVSPATQILVWKITESFDELRSQVTLKPKTEKRLNGMKSEMHQRAFLSVRMLLQEAGINDFDLHYDEFGKPYLSDHRYISITHSHNFASIIISEETVGIDMELQREKILRIADKFVDCEFDYLELESLDEYIKKLTVIWGAKEAIFKIRNEKGISFKDHIQVAPFSLTENQTQACLLFDNLEKMFEVNYLEIENFTLVYAFEK